MMKRIKSDSGALSGQSIFSLVFIFLMMGTLVLLIMSKDNYELVEKDAKELIALQDNVSANGEFFLGSGSIDSENYYYYMYSIESGGLKQDKVSASSVTLFYLEDANEKPRIVEFEKEYKGLLSIALNNAIKERSTYEIYIPKGSITEEISIDLK